MFCGEAVEGLARRHHRGVGIGGGAHRDPARNLLGGGVDNVEAGAAKRLDPRAADVEFGVVAHPKAPLI